MAVGQSTASPEALKSLHAFPAASAGQARWLIWLEPKPNSVEECNLRVQLRVGVEILVDGVNQYSLAGGLVRRPVQGWGYDSYYYEGDTGVASTRIAGKEKSTLKTVWAEPELVRYNSRLPVVVYAPSDLKLSFRLMAATTDYIDVSTG